MIKQISDSGLFRDAECEEEIEGSSCSSPVLQAQPCLPQRVHSPILHTCVPLDIVQPHRKRKSETESSLPCKKLNPEDKSYIMYVQS